VALVGPNGAGKSTLILHLNGILRDQGQVFVCGLLVEEQKLAEIRAAVGLVFQDPDDQLFSPKVYEDVAFGPIYMGLAESEVNSRVLDALKAVGMQGFEDRVSHHLSQGEKKRVAIATVLAMEPEILVLDEPTSGLDPRARRSLIDLLRVLPQTMLVSTHDMRLVAELIPRTIVIDEGMIVFDGSTQKLLHDADFLDAHGLEGV
jgi:cobalt transport protein ATP-binding subunit